MRVLLVQDHAILRESLRTMIATQCPGVREVVGCGGMDAAAEALRDRPFNLAFIDGGLAATEAADRVRWIRRKHPRVPVFVMSLLPEKWSRDLLHEAGAEAVFDPSSDPQQMCDAIELVAKRATS